MRIEKWTKQKKSLPIFKLIFCCCCYVTSVVSDSVQPHRQQPTRLRRPWDSPGKNAGVGCHFLLQCMKVKSESEVVQSCPTLSDPMDCSLPGSSVHRIFPGKNIGVRCHSGVITLRHVGSSQSGIEALSPALSGGFPTTEPPCHF